MMLDLIIVDSDWTWVSDSLNLVLYLAADASGKFNAISSGGCFCLSPCTVCVGCIPELLGFDRSVGSFRDEIFVPHSEMRSLRWCTCCIQACSELLASCAAANIQVGTHCSARCDFCTSLGGGKPKRCERTGKRKQDRAWINWCICIVSNKGLFGSSRG